MAAKSRKKKQPGKGRIAFHRKLARTLAIAFPLVAIGFAALGDWFVHQPRAWREEKAASWPSALTGALNAAGGWAGDFTDAIGLTGHDCVYEYDEEPPAGKVFFAGVPRRIGAPAPADVQLLMRGEFAIGWSPSLRHPVWAAYHVKAEALFEDGKRPAFAKDRAVESSPPASAYDRCGYDRGHMVPNHAIVSRYGDEERRRTFLMTNIAPQRPALNRGIWRDLEHRIADMWTARYGEVWVVVCTIPAPSSFGRETISGTGIDVPAGFGQLVVAQTAQGVRAFAAVIPQTVPFGVYPAAYLVSIDELEALTGFDFLSELPEFIQNPLEAETPTRVWPVGFADACRLVAGKLLGR